MGPSRFAGPPGSLHCAVPTPHMTGPECLRDRGSQGPPLTSVSMLVNSACVPLPFLHPVLGYMRSDCKYRLS